MINQPKNRKIGKLIKLITYTVIISFLCQNISWAISPNLNNKIFSNKKISIQKLAKDSPLEEGDEVLGALLETAARNPKAVRESLSESEAYIDERVEAKILEEMHDLYSKREKKRKFEEYFLEEIPADIRLIKSDDGELYKFRHRDGEDLPDLIELNKELFNSYSVESQVFLLRHCTDRIRYPRYKTIINDVKYLLTISPKERKKIFKEFRELGSCELVMFLQKLFNKYKRKMIKRRILKKKLSRKTKNDIGEYVGLKFKEYTSPDGAEIAYAVGGNPNAEKTLVFLHGFSVNSRDFQYQITVFEDKYKIITIDSRGHGKSKGTGSWIPDIKNYTHDLNGILEEEKIDNAVLVGHSMGGMIALNVAEIYEDIPEEERRIKGLVLIASIAGDPLRSLFAGKINTLKGLALWIFVYLSQYKMAWDNPIFKILTKRGPMNSLSMKAAKIGIMHEDTHPTFMKKVVRSVFKNDLETLIYAGWSILTHNVIDRMERFGINIHVPVLWISGDNEKVLLTKHQEEDAGKIENCKFVKLKNTRHYPHATRPRRVNNEIENFLDDAVYSTDKAQHPKSKNTGSERSRSMAAQEASAIDRSL